MDPLLAARWDEISSLLDDVLALPLADREGWIEANIGDEFLRKALLALARPQPTGAVIVDGDPAAFAQIAIEASDSAPGLIGREVGPYRLTALIGEGGMASVFRAERIDGSFVQVVAIKLLRYGVLDPFEQRRFAGERQILARLEHPHIARLIDGGLTAEGVPWFAMELVQGIPITGYCDERRLNLESRLNLFIDVCEAVQFAHQSLVVHRDLKPSNILVKTNGEIKLLDFGIAKLIGNDAEALASTQTGNRRLTPDYAAPEQWRGSVVTTATDVYSLGVLLHELLVGHRPQWREDHSLRLPSGMLQGIPDATGIAGMRRLTSTTLRQRLSGDLDTILTCALRHDPMQRYPSAAALSEDIRRFLIHKPIRARPDAWLYRAGKFLMRHRKPLVAITLLAVSIVVGVIATLNQAHQARLAAAESQEQARIARAETTRADAVKTFLLDLFHNATPEGPDHNETANELLIRGEKTVERAFEHEPQLQAEIFGMIGMVLFERDQIEDAKEPMTKALALTQQITGPASIDTLRAQIWLAQINEYEGKFDDAKARLQAAIDTYRNAGGKPVEALANAINELGVNYGKQGDYVHAIRLGRESLTMAQSVLPPDDLEIFNIMGPLSEFLSRTGETAEAETLARAAVTRYRKEYGNVHAEVARVLGLLAFPLIDGGKLDEAEATLHEAVAIDEKVFHGPSLSATSDLANLGAVLLREGRYTEAKTEFQRALDIEDKVYPVDDPSFISEWHNLAMISIAQGEYAAGLKQERHALRIAQATLGPNHPQTAQIHYGISQALLGLGQLDEAARAAGMALTINERVSAHQRSTYTDRLVLVRIALRRGDSQNALMQIKPLDDEIAKQFGRQHWLSFDAALLHGECALAAKHLEDARTIFANAATIAREVHPIVPLQLLKADVNLGDTLIRLKHFDEARQALNEAQAQSRALDKEPSVARDELRARLAHLLHSRG